VAFTIVILIITSISVTISGFLAEAIITPNPEAAAYEAISWGSLLALFGRTIYAFLPYIALGLLLVVLTGSNGIGIALSMGYYIGETVVEGILDVYSWSGQVFTYMLGANISGWQSTSGPALGDEDAIVTFGNLSVMTHGFVIVTIYIAVLTGVAFWLFMRRDIAGAKGA